MYILRQVHHVSKLLKLRVLHFEINKLDRTFSVYYASILLVKINYSTYGNRIVNTFDDE